MRRRQRVAVLGGGLQGCCVALALAADGAEVVLFDRNTALMSRAFVAAEGKIHLGHVYAGDASLATARMMKQGALTFAPLIERWCGGQVPYALSSPFDYLVHEDSQLTLGQFGDYLNAVHHLLTEDVPPNGSYFGEPITAAVPIPTDELNDAYAGGAVVGGFRTPEVAVHPGVLAQALRMRIASDPAIEVRLEHRVDSVEDDAAGLAVVARTGDRPVRESFDHVVNALWDGRLALDETRGLKPGRSWLYRFKHGIRFRLPASRQPIPSTTIVLGPFGDTVAYGDGTYYLSWYPAGMLATSSDVSPPEWPAFPDPALAEKIVAESIVGMADSVTALTGLDPSELIGASVMGGVIVAWGSTDIDDPKSLLHQRHEIGVHSWGRYHSIDPGKLTMAPYFASVCASRIGGEA